VLVKELADQKHPFIYYDEPATKARAIIREFGLRILPVTDKNKKLLGKISRRDIMIITSAVSAIQAKGVMTDPKCVLTMKDEISFAVNEMLRQTAWYALVIDSPQDKTYRAVLSLEDYIRVKLQKDPNRLSKPVSDIMTKEIVTCTPEDEIDNVWRMMQIRSLAGLPVVRKDKLVGIISQKDMLEHGEVLPTFESKKGRFRAPSKVAAIMKTPVATVKPSTRIADAAKIMVTRSVGRIPVVDDRSRLVGIVDREDIAHFLLCGEVE